MRRFLLFASLLLLGLYTGHGAFAYDFETDGIHYNILASGNGDEVEVAGYDKVGGKISILQKLHSTAKRTM